jgi:hypothetical protein
VVLALGRGNERGQAPAGVERGVGEARDGRVRRQDAVLYLAQIAAAVVDPDGELGQRPVAADPAAAEFDPEFGHTSTVDETGASQDTDKGPFPGCLLPDRGRFEVGDMRMDRSRPSL